jgi:superfamily II helicase
MDFAAFSGGLIHLTSAVGLVLIATLYARCEYPGRRLVIASLALGAAWLVLQSIQTLTPVSRALQALLR